MNCLLKWIYMRYGVTDDSFQLQIICYKLAVRKGRVHNVPISTCSGNVYDLLWVSQQHVYFNLAKIFRGGEYEKYYILTVVFRFTHRGQSFICNECGGHFNSRAALRGHLRSHRKLRHHKCEVCNKTFLDKQVCTFSRILQFRHPPPHKFLERIKIVKEGSRSNINTKQ